MIILVLCHTHTALSQKNSILLKVVWKSFFYKMIILVLCHTHTALLQKKKTLALVQKDNLFLFLLSVKVLQLIFDGKSCVNLIIIIIIFAVLLCHCKIFVFFFRLFFNGKSRCGINLFTCLVLQNLNLFFSVMRKLPLIYSIENRLTSTPKPNAQRLNHSLSQIREGG